MIKRLYTILLFIYVIIYTIIIFAVLGLIVICPITWLIWIFTGYSIPSNYIRWFEKKVNELVNKIL